MAKRLSTFFGGHKKDKSEDSGLAVNTKPSSRRTSQVYSASTSPVYGTGKLHKQRSELSLGGTEIPPLEPPPTFREGATGITPRTSSRPVSRGGPADYATSSRGSSRSRPQTPNFLNVPPSIGPPAPLGTSSPTTSGKLSKRKSFTPGNRSDKPRFGEGESDGDAWIAGLKERIPYELSALLSGGQVAELWDPTGDVIVHIYPENSGRGPSFRVHGSVFADSVSLNYLAVPNVNDSFQQLSLLGHDDFGEPLMHSDIRHSRDTSIPSITSSAPSQPKVVCLPLELDADYSAPDAIPKGDDLELIVLYRNFFAFLVGGALISTPRQVSLFSIFMGITTILRRIGYTNDDATTWGDTAHMSFARYCDELRLGDVRTSREKTIEAIVLGENMKFWDLYNEGFVHAAGRLDEIKSIKSPKLNRISPITLNRLERASLDVAARLQVLHHRLDDFDFPSMFSGLANSQTATEAKSVRFKAWRLAFIDMRKFALAQYRRRYGAWPPKAKSKKNNFDQDGLNRLLVRQMYEDFCDLYDMLANSRSMTTRTTDLKPMQEEKGLSETFEHALRGIESEFDRSTPPVIPAIPFDIPLIPSLDSSFKGGETLMSNKGGAKLKANETNAILLGSYNREYIKPSAFVQEFIAYERRLNANATLDQIVDNRCGQWLFIYAVLQSLPMTAIDARGIRYADGCEYFLFSAPRGGKPWVREDTLTSKAWYNVLSAGQTLSLSADVLDHQPEGIYRRSHCWLIADQWLRDAGQLPAGQPVQAQNGSQIQQTSDHSFAGRSTAPMQPDPSVSPYLAPVVPSNESQAGLSKSSSYANLQVNMQQVQAPKKSPRPASQYNPSITFDSILGAGTDSKAEKKKKK